VTSKPRSLQVVVVSQQVPLLHEVSWTLEAVGVKVQTSDDYDQNALWRRYSIVDFVIVDTEGVAEPATAAVFAHHSDNPIYRIFLYDPSKRTDFSAWFAAGAHDGLRKPVSRGEVLARIRTGARYLEFERRLQNQSSRSIVPGMYSRRGFVRKLQKVAANDVQSAAQNSLLVSAIDWFDGIRQIGGQAASNSIVQMAGRAIKRIAGESSVSAYLGDGRFVTLLVGQSPASAKGAAELIAADFSSRESHRDSVPRPAMTSAVVPWSASCDAVRCLNDALETLAIAVHSGGGRVLEQGEYSKDLAAWNQEISTGNPFTSVVAQDIMEPFPAVFDSNDRHAELVDSFRRADIAVRPYVDRDGRLVGTVANEQNSSDTSTDNSCNAVESPLATPETIPHDATFPEIYEAFSSRGCSALVVTADNRPLGYVTRDGFLAMIDPIDADSYASNCEATDDLSYLVVPAMIGNDEVEASVRA
jgi:GGDEF domain-containing protein